MEKSEKNLVQAPASAGQADYRRSVKVEGAAVYPGAG